MPNKPKASLTPYKVKRVAALFSRGESPERIAEYLRGRYHKDLPVDDVRRMYLESSAGRTNLATLFQGNDRKTILWVYNLWLQKELNTRAKKSAAKKGEKNPMRLRGHTDEEKRRMSAARMGDKNPMHGKTYRHSPKAKNGMSAARMGDKNPMWLRKHTPMSKAKMRARRELYYAKLRAGILATIIERGVVPAEEYVKVSFRTTERRRIAGTISTEDKGGTAIRDAMKKLTPNERRLVIGEFYEDKSIREISGDIGVTLEEIRRLRESAFKKLENELKGLVKHNLE